MVCNDLVVTDTPEPVADKSPRLGAHRFDCPRCHAFADQKWEALVRRYSDDSGFHDTPGWTRLENGAIAQSDTGGWNVSVCASCGEWTVWRDEAIMFPRTSTLPPAARDMPGDVLDLYEEGRAVWPVSRRAGAALARAALEKMLRSEPAASKKDDLVALIGKAKPTLPSHVGTLLDIVRHAGNKSLHVEDEPDDVMVLVLDEGNTDIGTIIFEAINLLVDERITKPGAVAALYAGLPDGVKESIERRAKEDNAAS